MPETEEKVPKTWDEWPDATGLMLKAGDYVAIATVNGKSPQLVIGIIDRINRVNSRGEEITDRKFKEFDEPRVDEQTGRKQLGEYVKVPSCTMTVSPIVDGRGFTRWGNRKKNTYQIPGNIVKIDPAGIVAQHEALRDDIMDLARELEG